jgi:alpha-L-rhamnosidase
LVAGIKPGSPGFSSVRIGPHLGDLGELTAKYPHPKGMITVHFTRKGTQLNGTVALPPGLEGVFVWQGKQEVLHSGNNEITAP